MDRTDGLLPIGLVAKSFGVNESTIRRMESSGLLTPAFIAEKSRYRYYDSENIARISTILNLRYFGFVNDDISDYLLHRQNNMELYEKLVEKQNALAVLIEKMKRRIKVPDHAQPDVLEYTETYCVTKQTHMVPRLTSLSEFCKQFVFETIKGGYPIDCTRPIIIFTSCMDYRNYRRDSEQDLIFCVPLKKKVSKPNVMFLPSRQVVSVSWNHPMKDYDDFIPVIDDMFSAYGARQNGTLSMAYDFGTHMGSDIDPMDTVMHVLVPFE